MQFLSLSLCVNSVQIAQPFSLYTVGGWEGVQYTHTTIAINILGTPVINIKGIGSGDTGLVFTWYQIDTKIFDYRPTLIITELCVQVL